MFTLGQINEIHDQFGRADSLPQYLQALKDIGVDKYDTYITDGHSEYFGANGHKVTSPPGHEMLTVTVVSSRENLIEHLDLHSHLKTSYLEMSKGLADSGIEKWTFDTKNMKITYYDKAGNEMVSKALLKDT